MPKAAEKTSRGRSGRGLVSSDPEGKGSDFAKVFAALGEPTRLRIMQMLPREPICEQMWNVIELAEELGLTQPTVSHHLKILAEAGVVQCRRQCNSLYFYVDQAAVGAWLKETRERFGCDQCAD